MGSLRPWFMNPPSYSSSTEQLTTTPLAAQPAIIRPASEPPQMALSQTPAANAASSTSPAVAQLAASTQTSDDRYRDGMVIWETPEDAKVPFLLKFNINTQLRYLKHS